MCVAMGCMPGMGARACGMRTSPIGMCIAVLPVGLNLRSCMRASTASDARPEIATGSTPSDRAHSSAMPSRTQKLR